MCRRWAGGPLLAMQTSQVVFDSGDALQWWTSSAWAERGFCSICGSSLFCRVTAEGPAQGAIHLALDSLDDQSGLELRNELFTDLRPTGYQFAGELQGLTGAEVFAKFGSG